jgi:hypothetical protein
MLGDDYNQKTSLNVVNYPRKDNYQNDYKNSQRAVPVISIKEDVYRKLMAYARLCDNEISALGTVNIVNGSLLIDSVQLFDQTVTGSSTDLSSEDISKFLFECVKSGKNPESLKFWWHSHVNMAAFWSATDNGTIDRFKSGWMISMVSNKRDEFKLRLDLFEPFRLTKDNLSLDIDYSNAELDKTVIHEIREKVRTVSPIDTFRSALRDTQSFFNRNPAYTIPSLPERESENITDPVYPPTPATIPPLSVAKYPPRNQDPDRDEYTLFREV